MTYQVQSPVAFFIFNRPDLTEQVFARIAELRPARLFVVADGPRTEHEHKQCARTRAVIERVDWPCEVKTLYADSNMGLRSRLSSGLDWIFSHVEDVIVLEDDCLASIDFFRFCDELLERYRDNEKVMMITGTTIGETWKPGRQSYHFSRRGNVWGWASWRRAWKHYDVDMKLWTDESIRTRIRRQLGSEHFRGFAGWMQGAYLKRTDVWSLQWVFAILAQDALSIVPSGNLVSNIGFREDATHTKTHRADLANLKTYPATFPLRHPARVEADVDYDRRFFKLRHNLKKLSLWQRLRGRLSKLPRALGYTK